ncbi:MAG: trypsin-like peptidase domain-containing protein [Acidimicrobiales bacterium]
MSEDTEQPGPESAAGTPEVTPPPEATPPPETPPALPDPVSGDPAPAGEPIPAGEPATAPHLPAVAPSSYPPPPAWSSPAGGDTPTAPPAAPAVVPFSYPPPPDPGRRGAPGTTGGGSGRFRTWLPVALVAALIGGVVGAAVTAIADHNGNGGGAGVTIHESAASPGAAVLSGNVTIPQLVDKVIPAVVSIDVKSGGSEDEGTGMIITSDGEVITNNHVIELYSQGGDTGSITVTEYGQTKALPSTLIGYDQTKDVALLKINNASNLPTVTFGNSGKAVVGDAVVAIGNALGLSAGTPTVTQGIVSALGRSVTAGGEGTQTETLQNLIQTDAAINAGNSGGPLIDTAGQVIAMNTAVAGTSSDGTSSQNIGFAIPIAQVESLLPELQKGGQAGNGGGYLGVDITTLTPALRQQYGFTPTSGAVILTVVSGSPAAKAGLVQGDVIVNIAGTDITSAEDLQKVIQNSKPGQSVSITYYVGDSKRTTKATLGNQQEAQQQQSQSGSSTNPFGGGGFPGFGNSGSSGSTGSTP